MQELVGLERSHKHETGADGLLCCHLQWADTKRELQLRVEQAPDFREICRIYRNLSPDLAVCERRAWVLPATQYRLNLRQRLARWQFKLHLEGRQQMQSTPCCHPVDFKVHVLYMCT